MKKHAPKTQIEHIIEKITETGLQPVPLYGTERTVIAVIGDERILNAKHLRSFTGVSDVMEVLKPYKLASRETKYEDTIVNINGVKIGGKEICVMAGPCTIENEEQTNSIAAAVKKSGAKILRGGAFKPRTGPYSFEGHGEKGLQIMKKACDDNGLLMVTEAMDKNQLDTVIKYADIVQLGARNMQNYSLLRDLGKCGKPVLLKRGLSATLKEWLLAAEYILSGGNQDVILCERGIRTFENEVRFSLSISSIPVLKELTHLPIIVDPSHAAGKASLVPSLSKAALAAGADGLIVEVHNNPEEALCDGDQALTMENFDRFMKDIKPLAPALNKTI